MNRPSGCKDRDGCDPMAGEYQGRACVICIGKLQKSFTHGVAAGEHEFELCVHSGTQISISLTREDMVSLPKMLTEALELAGGA